MRLNYWTIKPEWQGEIVAILGGGPSLTPEQVDYCRGRCRVIAVNNAYTLAPWADLLYWSDEHWYGWHRDTSEFKAFAGVKVALANARTWAHDASIRVLANYGDGPGLCTLPDGVFTGRSSGYQAVTLAVHLGAAAIVLLGFDMRAIDGRTHWHDAHKRPTAPQDFAKVMLPPFASLVEPLAARGVQVWNATPASAIACFPCVALETLWNEELAA